MSIEFSNGRQYLADKETDPYLRGFLSDIYLRPSCHECAAKGEKRVSDITIGDAWGMDSILNGNNSGVSVIMLHSSKAQALFSSLKEQLHCIPLADTQLVKKGNSALMQSSAIKSTRRQFMAQLPGTKRIDRLINQNCRDPLVLAVKKKAKRMIRGI